MSHSSIRIEAGQNGNVQGSTRDAEAREKYFAAIKFSTQVLISLWKMAARRELTSHSSMRCLGLHKFWATGSLSDTRAAVRESRATQIVRNQRD
jgi:hypothetical protein